MGKTSKVCEERREISNGVQHENITRRIEKSRDKSDLKELATSSRTAVGSPKRKYSLGTQQDA